jgi:hypothetical protein
MTEVALWGGWSLRLPTQCVVERNPDGSWSAMDGPRRVDVHIIEVGGDRSGAPMAAELMLGAAESTPGAAADLTGDGWIGYSELTQETDEVGTIQWRAVTAAAPNTLMSCWIAYRDAPDAAWADAVVGSLRHTPPAGKRRWFGRR